jgi:hypothetical protein
LIEIQMFSQKSISLYILKKIHFIKDFFYNLLFYYIGIGLHCLVAANEGNRLLCKERQAEPCTSCSAKPTIPIFS